MDLDITTKVDLNHGGPMPIFGLGTFRSPEGNPTRTAVTTALDSGYRMIDTAAIYGNEESVGQALRDHGVARDEVFVTTKLARDDHGFDSALAAIDESLGKLGLDHVDLYLIHWPGDQDAPGDRAGSWRALEQIRKEGRARAIGVSNYMVDHLREVLEQGDTVPAVNQFELHPFNFGSRRDVIEFCRDHDIVVEGYSPLTKTERLDNPALQDIADAHDKTVAQVMIRWALQHHIVTIPKSTTPERIRENADVFDFQLDQDQMRRIDQLDEDFITSWDPRDVD